MSELNRGMYIVGAFRRIVGLSELIDHLGSAARCTCRRMFLEIQVISGCIVNVEHYAVLRPYANAVWIYRDCGAHTSAPVFIKLMK